MRSVRRLSPLPRVVAVFCAIACVSNLGSARPADAPSGDVHRFRWHGRIDDVDFWVGRAKSGGDVNRLPQPYTSSHVIKVEFEYVQQIAADGSESWPERHLTWSLEGAQGDDTFTEGCHGAGSLDLGPASSSGTLTDEQRNSLKATCEHKKLAISWRMYGRLESMPPLPEIPAVSYLDKNCTYRKEEGTRRTIIWMTPDVDAVVEMDTKPGSEYAKFVPVPGRFVELTVKTVPVFPARFRFVIDREHTSNFAGYAGNASIDEGFFKRYGLEHLAGEYTDSSPDLIFDKQHFQGSAWSTVKQDVVETATEQGMAVARVSAMDYGAIGKVGVYVQCKCGGQGSSAKGGAVWTPAKVLVGGKPHDAVSVPLDEDNNLMADALEDYKGDPGRDDDADPEGDGTKGDGLTTFEEYRGFMTKGGDCFDPANDLFVRTTPRFKELFVYASNEILDRASGWAGWAGDIPIISLCDRHLTGVSTVKDAVNNAPEGRGTLSVDPDTRVVNFTLQRARQRKFLDHVVSLPEPQHGVIVMAVGSSNPLLGGAPALAVPVSDPSELGPPKHTAAVLVLARQEIAESLRATMHELGHAMGIPHHSDRRTGWRVRPGVLNVVPALSPLQAAGIELFSEDAKVLEGQPTPDALLVEPGPACTQKNRAAAYRDGKFAGCLTSVIVRRGQQCSGDVACPMRYKYTDFYEPPGAKAEYTWTGTVTDGPDVKVEGPGTGAASAASGSASAGRGIDPRAVPEGGDQHVFSVDAWRGNLLQWPEGHHWPLGYFCRSPQGTDVNAAHGSRNLAGDAGRAEPCRGYLVVNDNADKDSK